MTPTADVWSGTCVPLAGGGFSSLFEMLGVQHGYSATLSTIHLRDSGGWAMSSEVPYGTWHSPISAEALVKGAVSIEDVILDGENVWWLEARPDEAGRVAVVRWAAGECTEVTPAEANVRTRVHEYGGGAWWVDRDVCYYVDFADQRVRSITPGTSPVLLSKDTTVENGLRFADFRLTPDRRWLIAVAEDHTHTAAEPRNSLVALATDGSGTLYELVAGADFYSSPRLSSDGRQIAWVQWNHPNMPWDDTELLLGRLDLTGEQPVLLDVHRVAGGPGEAVQQPSWSADGGLYYLSDRRNYWHLYRLGQHEPVLAPEGDIGEPGWVFGQSSYALLDNGEPVVAVRHNGICRLDEHPQYTAIRCLRSNGKKIAFLGSDWYRESAVVLDGREIRPPRESGFAPEFFRAAEQITFDTGVGERAHALYFQPSNPDYHGPSSEKPPLIVLAHGGPTAAARSDLVLARHYWTSRGFGVADINYRGSSGYGRQYRQQLYGAWGIADVEDCVRAAQYLVRRGDVDPQRLIIRGGSAGGFTVLSALAFHDVFTAGASLYGVADLEALLADTHKFESRYLDNLVGPYPEMRQRYRERSPINCLDGFNAPMIVLQGDEDAVVPPNQSRSIVDALNRRGVPVAYVEYAGEQHGFRKAETIRHALLSELTFYGRIFGFEPADDSIPLEIHHFNDD